MVLILTLVLEAGFIHGMIVDHNRVAHLYGVVGVRFMRGRIGRRIAGNDEGAGVQIAVLGLRPEAVARGECVPGAKLPIDSGRSIVADALIEKIDSEALIERIRAGGAGLIDRIGN